MSVFIHNTIFAVQNGVKRNEESIENQCGSSFAGMTESLYFQTYGKLRTFKKISYLFQVDIKGFSGLRLESLVLCLYWRTKIKWFFLISEWLLIYS